MKKSVLIILYLIFSQHTFGQKNSGYYGKNTFIQIEGLANYPLFSNLLSDGNYSYGSNGNFLQNKKDNFNFGFRINAGYAVKRNIALSLEFGQDYSSIYPNTYSYVYDNSYMYSVQHEMIDIATTVFIPKIEFGTSKSLLPMGLSHQIGFGLAFSKAMEKDYLYRYFDEYNYISEEYQNYSTNSTGIDPINFESIEKVRKFVLLYALSMRTPVSKSLMIHYGIKYTLNVGKPNYHTYANEGNKDYTNSLLYVMSKHRLYSFINANVGLTYVF